MCDEVPRLKATDEEYLSVREQKIRRFIDKAVTACETTGVKVSDHFRDVTKMVKTMELPKGANDK
ncbi:MAG: hypothetical protein V1897_19205 [Pseudomonadota bacterium]